MAQCSCARTIGLGDGYSLFFMGGQESGAGGRGSLPSPKARSFELPGDTLQYAPDRPADVEHVKLVITLDFENETISGTASTRFSALYEEVKTITFDAIDLHVEEVALADGKKLAYNNTGKKLIVTLDRPYQYGEQFTVAVTYHAKPRIGLRFVKPAPEDPTRPVQAWTFGQPRYHSNWFPCHDAPNDRATTEIIVTVPANFLTVANGNLLGVTDNGATKTHHWLHDVPHATYLVSLVVGEFAVIEDSYNGKPVTYYVRKDRKDDAHFYLGKTPRMMEFFSQYTGVEYPYSQYMQTVVELFGGAMEHTTCTTHSFGLLIDGKMALDRQPEFESVTAHELAHQWFGDLVTCRDWPNGWLNEGFATYCQELWGQHDLGDDFFKQSMLSLKEGYLQEDAQYRRPVVYHSYYDHGMELFDGHLYNKGGWVLHMLRHQLGDATFRRAIKAYLERYRTKEVITADLERTFEEITGRSLGRFFQQWIYSGGYPEFEVDYSWDNETKMARVKIKQTQKVDDLTPCFLTPVDLAFTVPAVDEHTDDMRTVAMRVMVGEDGQVEQSFYIPLEREPAMVRFDPDGWLLKTLKFERPTKLLLAQLRHDPDILGRMEAADSLADHDEPEVMEALATTLNTDPFWSVRNAAAKALGKKKSEQAQAILIKALQELDASEWARVRSTIAGALGNFQAPQQPELAQRSAQALRSVLEQSEVSYNVESASASSLGKTRSGDNIDFLAKLIARPSWMSTVQYGIFAGLGSTGDDRVIDLIAGYLLDSANHITLRTAAARGLFTVGSNRNDYSEEARQRAVTALMHAVEHDSWGQARGISAAALQTFGEKRAIAALERAASQEIDSLWQRRMRSAALALRSGDKTDEALKQLRKDLDEVREENRKLKEQLNGLQARIK